MGFPIFDLPPGIRLTLQASMSILEAEDRLKAGVPDDQLYDVAIAAGLTPDEASELLSQRIAGRLRKNEEVEL